MSAERRTGGAVICPTGAPCPPACDRTVTTCAQWGPDADHAEALRVNAMYPPGHPRLESMASFMARMPIEAIQVGDAHIEQSAAAFGAITGLSGVGDLLREAWAAIRPEPTCDCPLDPHHRWNCALTPIWAQTIRDLDTNPWGALEAIDTILAWDFPTMCPICNFNVGRECVPAYDNPICGWCWRLNRHREPELWHCADCGQFVSGGKRMQVIVSGAVVIVCPEHFASRIGAAL